jgi:hypothetical protein
MHQHINNQDRYRDPVERRKTPQKRKRTAESKSVHENYSWRLADTAKAVMSSGPLRSPPD